jgi:hypothetical protein
MAKRDLWKVGGAALIIGLAGPAAAEDPLSAIDWLTDSVEAPLPVAAKPVPGATPGEPKVTESAAPETVTVIPLGAELPDAAGVLSVTVTGLPRNLWGPTSASDLARLIRSEQVELPPALQRLEMLLLLAEVDPPVDADQRGVLLLARIDKLLDIGALDQAAALIDRAGAGTTAEIFRRAFDVALLTGTEDAACQTLADSPALSPTYPVRIFCQARNGDWETAALTLGTARALGYVTERDDALLSRFLDPDLYEGDPVPPRHGPLTPLDYRLYQAIGEPVPTSTLPRAFAQAELSDTAGWKAQIEAAERLVRAGAIEPSRLFALYTERRPAASGGVWDRAAAVQALDKALAAKDAAKVAKTLPEAWDRMAEAELEPALAAMVGDRLQGIALADKAAKLAFQLALLTSDYEAAAQAREPANKAERFLAGLARGRPVAQDAPDRFSAAVAAGFASDGAPARVRSLVESGRTGEAILRAIDLVALGAAGEFDQLTDGLATLRALGLEDTARRAALEILVLDRRG